MSNVIDAEDRFLIFKAAAIEEMEREGELRELAATAASHYQSGLYALSNQIINKIPQEEKRQFQIYLQEYIKGNE